MSKTLTLPGLIDCHVHFREPGFPDKGTMQSESASARAGGVTTVCEMPNTDPPTTSVEAFKDKVKRAEEITDCDIHFFFGATEQAHLDEFRILWSDKTLRSRCAGLKLYFDHSTGHQKAEEDVIEKAFELSAELSIPLVGHCEDAELNTEATKKHAHPTDITAHSLCRPPESEEKAIAHAISLAKKYGTAFHVAHLSTKKGIALVRKAKKDGIKITCEVAPHHLFLSTNDYGALGTFGKMNPPLRSLEHCEALWEGIADGTVDCISTDHAPHTIEEKKSETAPSGVPGVETMLPLLLTVAAGGWPHPTSKRIPKKFTYKDIERLCFENPNSIFNLGKTKKNSGTIEIDPDAEWNLHAKTLHAHCGWTPYEGWRVKGKMTKVIS
jgi:dihydroorotase